MFVFVSPSPQTILSYFLIVIWSARKPTTERNNFFLACLCSISSVVITDLSLPLGSRDICFKRKRRKTSWSREFRLFQIKYLKKYYFLLRMWLKSFSAIFSFSFGVIFHVEYFMSGRRGYRTSDCIYWFA